MTFPVISARPLGRASLVIFSVIDADGNELAMEARVPGVFLPEAGTQVSVVVNAHQCHVFSAAG